MYVYVCVCMRTRIVRSFFFSFIRRNANKDFLRRVDGERFENYAFFLSRCELLLARVSKSVLKIHRYVNIYIYIKRSSHFFYTRMV